MEKRPLPSDPCVAMFSGAAARAAVFELKARMFVDAVGLDGSVTKSLDPLMKDVVGWMEQNSRRTPEERTMLERCANLRNRLFHADFSRATGQLVSLDVELKKEGVQMFSWQGDLTAQKLQESLKTPGVPVGQTSTRRGRLVFAWLLQSSQTGAFGAAARVFEEGCELLERTLTEHWDSDES